MHAWEREQWEEQHKKVCQAWYKERRDGRDPWNKQ